MINQILVTQRSHAVACICSQWPRRFHIKAVIACLNNMRLRHIASVTQAPGDSRRFERSMPIRTSVMNHGLNQPIWIVLLSYAFWYAINGILIIWIHVHRLPIVTIRESGEILYIFSVGFYMTMCWWIMTMVTKYWLQLISIGDKEGQNVNRMLESDNICLVPSRMSSNH